MSSSSDIVACIREKFLEAVQQDPAHMHLAAPLQEAIGQGKPPKTTTLIELYEAAVAAKKNHIASNGDVCK